MVTAGGGSLGAVQVGVLQALEDLTALIEAGRPADPERPADGDVELEALVP
jgi:hypothetical protein